MDYRAKNSIEKAIKKWVVDKLDKKSSDVDFNSIVNKIVNTIIRNDVFIIYKGFKICKN